MKPNLRGLFESIFKKPRAAVNGETYFKLLNGYTPVFTNAPESVYEMELTRAAIHQFANFASKLKPEMTGSAMRHLEKTLQTQPNPFMDASKFIYRVATILEVNNTAYIVPIEDERGVLVGYYPILPTSTEILERSGISYLRFTFSNGDKAAIEQSKVGILTKFQFDSDFIGADNAALRPTMQLIGVQNQGIINSVKNSASIRFLARVSNILKPDLVRQKREEFARTNLTAENTTGLLLYDKTFEDIKPIESKQFIVSSPQLQLINENVYRYFNTNENILTNKYSEEEWNAYYEGKIEPFALQLSLVMSNMTYSSRERACGNAIAFSANRLQYASNATKLNVSTQLLDRGIINRNEAREIWNMPHVEDGEKYYIRKEYAEVTKLGKENENAGE